MSDPERDDDPRLGTVLDQRYKLVERLGAGGMGVVYRGERVDGAGEVAVKFLYEAMAAVPDIVHRFRREAAAMRRLSHPHVTQVIDSGVDKGSPYLVMEFHRGKSLADIVDRGALSAKRAVLITRQILSGITHAHASGVVHRDLKPDNIILVESEGRQDFVKILDFGLAKIVRGEGQDASMLTTEGFAMGTPGYMSPEQGSGGKIDARSDIYSVGIMLYEMIVGQRPFVAEAPLAVLRMHMDDPPRPVRKAAPDARVSPELDQAILKSLEKAREKRFQTAAEFARALEMTPEGRESFDLLDVTDLATIDESQKMPAAQATGSHAKRERETVVGKRPSKPPRARRGSRLLGLLAVAVIGMAAWGIVDPASARRAVYRVRGWIAGDRPPPPPPRVARTTSSQTRPPGPPKPPPRPPAQKPIVVASTVEKPHVVAPPDLATPRDLSPPVDMAQLPDGSDGGEEADDAGAPENPGAKLEQEEARKEKEGPPQPPPPTMTPEKTADKARVERAKPAPQPPKKASMADAWKLLAAGRVDEAIMECYKVRRIAPRSAEAALVLGHAYSRKAWRSDAVREYGTALALKPSLKWNRVLQRNVVNALDGGSARAAEALIKNRLGRAALDELRIGARSGRTLGVHKRAAQLAQELGGGGGRKRRR